MQRHRDHGETDGKSHQRTGKARPQPRSAQGDTADQHTGQQPAQDQKGPIGARSLDSPARHKMPSDPPCRDGDSREKGKPDKRIMRPQTEWQRKDSPS